MFGIKPRSISRRSFLQVSGGVGIGLVVGFPATRGIAAASTGAGATMNAFVRISPDNTVTVVVKHLDKGQGVLTGLSTLVAEELDADWDQLRAEFAPADASLYNNLFWGQAQGTGGSTAIANSFEQYRRAGAAARHMLVTAAASRWQVPADEISVSGGVLRHDSGKQATFGELAEAAAQQPLPEDVRLKDPGDFKLIGNEKLRRIDGRSKTDGTATYTFDVKRPGMLIAMIAKPPKFGAKVVSFDASEAEKTPGVERVVQVPQGVAVLARNTHAAIQGRRALAIQWDDAGTEMRSSEELFREYTRLAETPGLPAAGHGDAEAALDGAADVIEMRFEFPFLAHAPMEPVNAVADLVPGESLEIWTGSQLQTVDQAVAAAIAGLEPQQVTVNTLLAGGSFGRRATPSADMVSEAVSIAVAIGGAVPVKLIWTREDDIRGGYYRPMYVHRLRARLDAQGKPLAWQHRIVGQSILKGTPFETAFTKDGIDGTSVEGASEIPYQIPHFSTELHTTEVGVPVLWWRSVGSTHTAYAVETMMDALAKAAGKDPVAFRLDLMDGHPREAGVLGLAVEKAGPVPEGLHRGVAVHKSFGTYVAEVADVRMTDAGKLEKVERVVCAVDCGQVVNPDQVRAQMEGGIGYGLGAILKNEITLKDGAVVQSQFYDYEPLRISEMPHVEVHMVDSTEAPTGVGEPATPVIGPAVANAIFAATGRHPTRLPFSRAGVLG